MNCGQLQHYGGIEMCILLLLIIITVTVMSIMLSSRDVTKFQFEFDELQQIQNSTNVLSTLSSNANLWQNRCSSTDFIRTYSQSAR